MSLIVPRLKHRSQFLQVAGTRRKWVTPGLIVQARQRMDENGRGLKIDDIRIGFTVSRKVGNAVERNRVRRRLRAAAQEIIPVHAQKGYDFVVIGRAETNKRPYANILSDLKTALKRLDAYRDI